MKLREKFAAVLALTGMAMISAVFFVLAVKIFGLAGLVVLLLGIALIAISIEIQSGV